VGSAAWQFAGVYSPHVKYFRPEHRIIRFGEKPFLIVTEQGNAGSGLSSKIESWIDLTESEFKPVMGFTSEGHLQRFQGGIGREVSALVVSLTTGPVERITVACNIEFRTVNSNHEDLAIGQRKDRVVYARSGKGDFEIDESLSTISAKDVGDFYDALDSDFTNEEFLKFNFKGLTDLARSSDLKGRSWLMDFLQRCAETAESLQLRSILAASP
jgi:hypothetical protein